MLGSCTYPGCSQRAAGGQRCAEHAQSMQLIEWRSPAHERFAPRAVLEDENEVTAVSAMRRVGKRRSPVA
jgi:hypothetical protein